VRFLWPDLISAGVLHIKTINNMNMMPQHVVIPFLKKLRGIFKEGSSFLDSWPRGEDEQSLAPFEKMLFEKCT